MSYIPELKQLLEIVHYDPKNPDNKIELGARIVIEGLLKRVAAAYNIEVFCVGVGAGEHGTLKPGFYWWSCSPGCLPDSEEPYGPYQTRYDCLDAATEGLLDLKMFDTGEPQGRGYVNQD